MLPRLWPLICRIWPAVVLGNALSQSSPAQIKAGDDSTKPLAVLYAENASLQRRREVVRCSLPFARGEYRELDGVSIRDHETAWLALTRWPDGSVQWAQAQFIDELPAAKVTRYEVVRAKAIDAERTFVTSPRLVETLLGGALTSEVEDVFGTVYRARLVPDKSAGPDGLLRSTPLVRTYRFRDYHRAVDAKKPGIGRDFLTLTAYLTLFHGFSHAELQIVLGNDYLGSDDPRSDDPNLRPLGNVRLRRFSLVVDSQSLAFVPRWIRENRLRPPEKLVDASGKQRGWRQHLIGPGAGHYLGDACVRRFPFVLYAPLGKAQEKPGDDAEKLRRASATAMAQAPLYALPAVNDVRRSGALGANGGPAPTTRGTRAAAAAQWQKWRSREHFGPYGTWGDVAMTPTTGTPRNTPVGLHLAVRSGDRRLMLRAEGWCLQQGLRPYHLYGLRVGVDDDIYLMGLPHRRGDRFVSKNTLGRSKLSAESAKHRDKLRVHLKRPHGMNAFDYEHMSVDVLYDFYCLSGQAWVRDELETLGWQLLGLLPRSKYGFSRVGTSRGEGWCMQALALCYQASGREEFKAHAIHRLAALRKARGKLGNPSTQSPDRRAFGEGVAWDAPWQQAAYILGMSAAFRSFGHEGFADLAVETCRYMATHGWEEGAGPKYFVSVEDPGGRFKSGRGSGTQEFCASALAVAAEIARARSQNADAELFERRLRELSQIYAHKGPEGLAASKWWQIPLDRRAARAER